MSKTHPKPAGILSPLPNSLNCVRGFEEHLAVVAEVERLAPGLLAKALEFPLSSYQRAAMEDLRTPSIAEEQMRHAGGDLHAVLRLREDLVGTLDEIRARREAVVKGGRS
jgi:hypothetical protein